MPLTYTVDASVLHRNRSHKDKTLKQTNKGMPADPMGTFIQVVSAKPLKQALWGLARQVQLSIGVESSADDQSECV